jgi:pimeloyl-ACP methyl ester carboxylesterase
MQEQGIFPGHWSQGHPVARFNAPYGTELLEFTTRSGETAAALHAAATDHAGNILPDAAHRPSMLFCYGNDMYLSMSVPIVQLLSRLGVNVLAPEYLGYGLSEGKPSEAGCYATADAAYDYLRDRSETIFVGGCSLGGAVAIDLAARQPVAGLATIVTFTSMADMVRLFYPYLPMRLILKYRFDNLTKIQRVKCPVLIGHSTGDRLIPYSMADRLAAAAKTPVSRLTIADAEHNPTSMIEMAGEQILNTMAQFFATCLDAAQSPSESE